MPPVIACNGLRVERGPIVALESVDLLVEPGTVLAVLGPNGAGKTTLVQTLTGVLEPTAGAVEVLGGDPRRDRARLAHRWSVMPQDGGLPMGATVGEAIRLFARLAGHPERVDDAVERCGLRDLVGRRWRRLSGGQQQRVSLAVALVGSRELLLLDEPTAAVDVEGRNDLLELLRSLAAEGSTVLVTTHEFEVVPRVASHAVVLRSGRLGQPTALADLRRPVAAVDVELTGPPSDDERERLADRLGRTVERRTDRLRVPGEPEAAFLAAVGAAAAELGLAVAGVTTARTTVEEWYEEQHP